MLRRLLLATFCCAAAPVFAAGDSRVKIAVLDLQARGVDPALAQSGGTLIASELNKLEVFKVISREDIRNMLSFEKDKERLGCEADQACLAEIGGALGVEYIIAGSLAAIGDQTVLSLTLNNMPISSKVLSKELPPLLMKGKGMPLLGSKSSTTLILISA